MNAWTIVAALISGVVALWIALGNRRASPYGEIAKRVVDLEKADEAKAQRIESLEGRIDQLEAHIDRLETDKGRLATYARTLIALLGIHAPDAHIPPWPEDQS